MSRYELYTLDGDLLADDCSIYERFTAEEVDRLENMNTMRDVADVMFTMGLSAHDHYVLDLTPPMDPEGKFTLGMAGGYARLGGYERQEASDGSNA